MRVEISHRSSPGWGYRPASKLGITHFQCEIHRFKTFQNRLFVGVLRKKRMFF